MQGPAPSLQRPFPSLPGSSVEGRTHAEDKALVTSPYRHLALGLACPDRLGCLCDDSSLNRKTSTGAAAMTTARAHKAGTVACGRW